MLAPKAKKARHKSALLLGRRTRMKHDAAKHLEYRKWQTAILNCGPSCYRLTLPPEGADRGWLDVQVREWRH